MSAAETLDALLRARYSCRAFLPDAVAQADIAAIVATAGRVPSWCNAQPWHVHVTSGAATERLRSGLAQHMQQAEDAPDLPFPKGYSGAHKERRRACGFQLYDAVGIEKGDRVASHVQMLKNFAFFGAPHVAVVSSGAELGGYGALDCGGFVTAFLLACEAKGLGAIPQAAPAVYAPFLRGHFGIPEDRWVLCCISFGYADPDAPENQFRTARADLSEIAEFHQ